MINTFPAETPRGVVVKSGKYHTTRHQACPKLGAIVLANAIKKTTSAEPDHTQRYRCCGCGEVRG